MKLSPLFLSLVLTRSFLTAAQFTCPLQGGQAKDTCVSTTDDDGSHCVWCSLSSFGLCVNEATAETIEQSIPSAQCDRSAGNDDDTKPATDDDKSPATDDDTKPEPSSDDKIKPIDDALPDNYWECFQQKDLKSCLAEDCTWCESKAGFSLCFGGPSAEFAKQSDFYFYKCQDNSNTIKTAAAASISTSTQFLRATVRNPDHASYPYDMSCLNAYKSDPTESGCTSASDQEGNACEWCTLAGMANLCLTAEQAQMGSSMGAQCGKEQSHVQAASSNDNESVKEQNRDNPYDSSCMMAYFQDQSKDACTAAKDEDGNPCEFCSFQGAIDLCLTSLQANTAQQLGATCDAMSVQPGAVELKSQADLFDKSCVTSFLDIGTEESCKATQDMSGGNCKWCHGVSVANLCLTASQADTMSQLGFWCDGDGNDAESTMTKVAFPDDFFACLQNYEEGDCKTNSCTWCNTQIHIGFCLSSPAADAMKQCTFFDCNYGDAIKEIKTPEIKLASSPYDTTCVQSTFENQSDAADACHGTKDSDGNPCVWCEANGIVGVCLTSDQAGAMGGFLQCDGKMGVAAVAAE